ncbi:MAG: ABC transporter ATP-binding protein [Planctomycetaceae bacterium]
MGLRWAVIHVVAFAIRDFLRDAGAREIRDISMPLIELRNISKTYDLGEVKVCALRQTELSIDRGEYVALLGPSGSGKSTLMNTLGCLDRPTTGSYLLDGKEVATLNRNARAGIRNRHIGFVFQNFNLLARTSALENVELPLLYGAAMSSRARKKRAREMLAMVGLEDRLDHHPGQLSGGQQQRVAIARSLVTNPSILMGDEPTGNLDSKTSREVIELFKKLNTEHQITVILVTHDLNVARHARRILVMRDGKIEMDTTRFEDAFESLHAFETSLPEQESPEVQSEHAE